MENEVIDVLEGLKNKKLDWVVYGDNSVINFKAEIKKVTEGATDSLIIKFKGALDYLRLDYPWECEKEETERKLCYKIATRGKTKVLVGYLK